MSARDRQPDPGGSDPQERGSDEEASEEPDENPTARHFDEAERRVSLYDRFAHQCGELDYETYWERRFEHNLNDESYRLAAIEFGRGLRELETDTRLSQAENLVREAYSESAAEDPLDFEQATRCQD